MLKELLLNAVCFILGGAVYRIFHLVDMAAKGKISVMGDMEYLLCIVGMAIIFSPLITFFLPP